MVIRQAQPSDARSVAEIHVCSWQRAYGGLIPDSLLDGLSIDEREKSWQQQFGVAAQTTLVAVDGDKVLGFVTFGSARDDDVKRGTAEIYAIYLHPNNWQRGIGCALWSRATRDLANSGFERAVVWVLDSNTRARRFYEVMGGVVESDAEKVIEYGGRQLVEVRYVCPLERISG